MTATDFDAVILGQGLAGTTLAWTLRWQGQRVLMLDRQHSETSSRVAAGLITPITGQRLVKSWRWEELWPLAVRFYDRVSQSTGVPHLRQVEFARLLSHADEEAQRLRRQSDPDYAPHIEPSITPPLEASVWNHTAGSWSLRPGGQLDVCGYLDASRRRFEVDGGFLAAELRLPDDLQLDPDGVTLPRLGVRAQQVYFCEGLAAQNNPWFHRIRFKPAQGEVLTLRIPGLDEPRIVHRGVWLAQVQGDLYRAGATYEWQRLDGQPSAAGRQEIESRLQEFLKLPYEVVRHQAAIRPIHIHQYPVLGRHPDFPQLACLNGLGSKGALQAPWCAAQLLHHITRQTPLDPLIDLNLRTDLHGCHP